MDEDSQPSAQPLAIPVIRTAVLEPQPDYPRHVRYSPENMQVGLVDTGADACVVDSTLVARLGLPQCGETTFQAAFGTRKCAVHRATFLFPQGGLQIHAECASIDIQAHGAPYPVVFGRALFALGRLTMDYITQDFAFYFQGNDVSGGKHSK